MKRLQPWRLTRTRYGRAVYERLAELGIRFATLDVYVRDCDGPGGPDGRNRSPPPGVRIAVDRASDVQVSDRPGALDEEDTVIRAFVDGSTVGRVFLSHARSVFVAPIEASVDVDGAYLWRLAVSRSHRQRGVATALLDRAMERADERGANVAYALVAVDNVPSKRTFAACAFEPRGRITYARLRRWKTRRVRTDPRLAPIRVESTPTN